MARECGLLVEQVDVRRTAALPQADDALGARRVVRQARQAAAVAADRVLTEAAVAIRAPGRARVLGEQRGERDAAETLAEAAQQRAPRSRGAGGVAAVRSPRVSHGTAPLRG